MSAVPAAIPPNHYTADDIARLHAAHDPDDYRPRFARDYDRLVHTPAFRRLQGKTQVVTPGEADFFRTRLTHSIEVAQVAQRLALKLNADPDLCEAAGVLHDLGHPPFGHIGEKTLNAILDDAADTWGLDPIADVGGFNGNAQNFRLAVKSLSHSASYRGLDLTRGVLDAAIKYPYPRAASAKSWCFYPTESADAEWVRDGVPAARVQAKSFEAQLVEWADDVAYAIHDVEDWYRAGFMPLELLAQDAAFLGKYIADISPKLIAEGFAATDITREAQAVFSMIASEGVTRRFDGSSTIKHAVRAMSHQLFQLFTKVGVVDQNAPPSRHNNDLRIDPDVRLQNRILKELLWQFVIDHPRMATHQAGQERVIEELFAIHIDALDFNPQTRTIGRRAKLTIFPIDTQDALTDPTTPLAERLRLVADHIAGMTDSYAIRLHRRLTGADSGVFNAFV